jgi:5-enolpyruvylshikimate-3-phosphate synthase
MLRLLGAVAGIAWLILVGAAYTAIYLFPPPPDGLTQATIPPDLSSASLPLLAALLILGIIRRTADIRRGAPDSPRR